MEKSGDTSKRDEGDGKTYRAPFAVRTVAADPTKLVFHNNIWKMSNQVVAERNMIADVRPLTDKFPVSAGLQHKATVEKDGRGGGGGGAVVGGEVGGREGGASTSNVFGDTKVSNCCCLSLQVWPSVTPHTSIMNLNFWASFDYYSHTKSFIWSE